MRALFPNRVDEVDVHASYATDWVDRGGVRVNFVSAVDGAVSAGGTSKGLQTPGDNRVFAALRDLADVVLVGSGTATAEKYGPVHPAGDRLAARREWALPDRLPIAVSSRSLRGLDPGSALFTDAAPDARTIVLTCASADAGHRRALAAVADVVDCGEDGIDPAGVRAVLAARGLTRVLCEGGPTVFAALAAAGAVDELCLSVSPVLGGPGAGRITAGAAWECAVPLHLHGALEDDGALFLRYRTASG